MIDLAELIWYLYLIPCMAMSLNMSPSSASSRLQNLWLGNAPLLIRRLSIHGLNCLSLSYLSKSLQTHNTCLIFLVPLVHLIFLAERVVQTLSHVPVAVIRLIFNTHENVVHGVLLRQSLLPFFEVLLHLRFFQRVASEGGPDCHLDSRFQGLHLA